MIQIWRWLASSSPQPSPYSQGVRCSNCLPEAIDDSSDKEDILRNQQQIGPFPMQRIKRVDNPTTLITDAVQRIDLREIAYGLATRGEYGPVVQKGVEKSLPVNTPFRQPRKISSTTSPWSDPIQQPQPSRQFFKTQKSLPAISKPQVSS